MVDGAQRLANLKIEIDAICASRVPLLEKLFSTEEEPEPSVAEELERLEHRLDELEAEELRIRLRDWDITPQLLSHMVGYLNDDFTLDVFKAWLYLMTWDLNHPANLIGRVKLLLAEHSGGYFPDEVLKSEFNKIVRRYSDWDVQ